MKNPKIKQLRFALIGCGRIAPKHVNAIISNPNAKLVAVCDIIKERAVKFGKEYNCDWFLNYNDVLKRKDVDVVTICTPHFIHAEICIASAKAKKHVITEKPMAMTLVDADRMIEECRKNNVKLFVVKQNRYNPPVKKLRQAINEGRFGKIFLGNVTVRWSRPQSYYDQDSWRGKINTDGGVLTNQASHHIDLLQWMMGPVESVTAKSGTMTHSIEADDTAVAILKFKSGAIGVIEATTSIFPKNIEGSISIFGENGSVKVGGFAVNKMELWQFKDFRNDDELIAGQSTNPPDVYGFGHIEFMNDVIDALLNNKSPNIDGEEARKSLELIVAIYQSAKTGQEVKLPLKSK